MLSFRYERLDPEYVTLVMIGTLSHQASAAA